MSVLSHDEIVAHVKKGSIKLEPYEEKNVGAASVDLRISRFFRRLVRKSDPIEVRPDVDYRNPNITQLVEVQEGSFLEVAPSETVLGITYERVGLADDICGWFEGRSRFARLGLLVHISAGFMQPGTFNNQVLEISNMGPRFLRVYPMTTICQFVFQKMIGAAHHGGRFREQTIDDFRSTPS
ncbi:dCTP deaminase [bacterium]|nr:dCTP deaminase [bacterium]